MMNTTIRRAIMMAVALAEVLAAAAAAVAILTEIHQNNQKVQTSNHMDRGHHIQTKK